MIIGISKEDGDRILENFLVDASKKKWECRVRQRIYENNG